MKNKDVDAKYKGKAFYTRVLKSMAETGHILGDVTAKIITKADTVYNPNITVSAAKNFTQNCIIPTGSWDMSDNSFQLTRWVGNALRDCKVDLETVEYNVEKYQRDALFAGIMKKLNTNTVSDIVAGATPVSSAIDLSTTEKIQDFVMTVLSEHKKYIVAKPVIDNGRYVPAPKQGQPFIAAASPIINKISAKLGLVNLESGAKSDFGRIRTTIGGVLLIDLQDAADADDRIIYGTAGAAFSAYREDNGFGVKLVSGELNSVESAAAADVDIAQGDEIIQSTSYFGGKIKTEAHVFDADKPLINAGTATI